MEALILKLALSSGSVFCWVALGLYAGDKHITSTPVIVAFISFLCGLSTYAAIRKYAEIAVLKHRMEKKKFEDIVRSRDVLKIRRAIISNPQKALRFVKFKALT